MADHGAETSRSASEERKKQMLKAKIVKSAKKKIEESEKVRTFAPAVARPHGQRSDSRAHAATGTP